MSIRIKNKEAVQLFATLKASTGKGPTALTIDLLRRELARLEEAEPSGEQPNAAGRKRERHP
jgi:hypothetical protein